MEEKLALVSIKDFQENAKRKLDKNAYLYYSSGALSEQTLHDNVNAYKGYLIYPHFGRDVSHISMETTILGQEINFPIGISPTGFHKLAHESGELATAKASAKHNTCMVTSMWSTYSAEKIAEASGNGLRWFQLNSLRDWHLMKILFKTAESTNYKAIVLTVDQPYIPICYERKKQGFHIPEHIQLGILTPDLVDPDLYHSVKPMSENESFLGANFTWPDLRKVKEITDLPLVVKGILTAEDAKLAVSHGADAIWVSNHGGRQLDCVPATIDVLQEICIAVKGKCEVYMDGGIRSGSDVLKALALGARAVFIGRPVLWGLACNGQNGVERVLEILKHELETVMALAGITTVSDIKPDIIRKRFLQSQL